MIEEYILEQKLISIRRRLHQEPEIGMVLPMTKALVIKELEAIGLNPKEVGQSGLIVDIQGEKSGPTLLLRADMDALPIQEESDLSFKSLNGNMHACGHDMHTAMLLGAAMILKEHEKEIVGRVRLMFQPGEEVNQGAIAMIEAGILSKPKVDAALAIHVVTGLPIECGVIGVPLIDGGFMSATDIINISVQGRGGHGAMPEKSIDALNVLTHIHIGLQSLNAREVAATEAMTLTFGMLNCGAAANVIPDKGYLKGTLRTFNEETRHYLHQRIEEIACGVGQQFRAEVEVTIDKGMPPLKNNRAFALDIKEILTEKFGRDRVLSMKEFYTERLMASEDFAHIAARVPSTILQIGAGNGHEGYTYPMHHPQARFDERALLVGAKTYAYSALEWLKANS